MKDRVVSIKISPWEAITSN